MIRIRRSSLIRSGILAGVIVALTTALSSITFAAEAVTIDTTVTSPNMPVYFDANKDGANKYPDELMGNFDGYNLTEGLKFHWAPVAGATYYRVSLIQYTPPNIGPDAPKTEIMVAHHAANDPNGPEFLMTSFGVGEPFCLNCVTEIVVTPETAKVVQAEDGSNQIVYTELPGTVTSKKFVITGLPSKEGPGGCYSEWVKFCRYVTSDPEDFEDCKSYFPMAKEFGFCSGSLP